MITTTRNRTLIWMLIISLSINISLIVSFGYNRSTKGLSSNQKSEQANGIETVRDAAFFISQLNFTDAQAQSSRGIHRQYNRTANRIATELNILRKQMVDELGREHSNKEHLAQINERFGLLHEELKQATVAYYLNMKELCDSEQQNQLYELFSEMVANEQDGGRRTGGRYGRGWQNRTGPNEN